ncbi:MAG: hypothetical protein M3N00_07575, partial [Actinomycetota bacterium]|nr:hypothetical protein [Actinomycetota bacterium]
MGMRVWLTALFVLVTAFAAVAAYEIVRPILEDTLNRASQARFEEVAEQFEEQNRLNNEWPVQRIKSFAATRGLQWGIVRVEGKGATTKLRGDDLQDWHPGVVKSAVENSRPRYKIEQVETGPRARQILATYAVPITVAGEEGTAVVFSEFFTESDVENVRAALDNVERLALLAGALAVLIAG